MCSRYISLLEVGGHSVHPLPFCLGRKGGEELNLLGGLDRTSTLRGRLLEKREGGDCLKRMGRGRGLGQFDTSMQTMVDQ